MRSNSAWTSLLAAVLGFGAAHLWYSATRREYPLAVEPLTSPSREEAAEASRLSTPASTSVDDELPGRRTRVAGARAEAVARPPTPQVTNQGTKPLRPGSAARPLLAALMLARVGPASGPQGGRDGSGSTSAVGRGGLQAKVEAAGWEHAFRAARALGRAPWDDRCFQFLGSASRLPGLYVSIEGNDNWVDASPSDSLRWFSAINPGLAADAAQEALERVCLERLRLLRSAVTIAIARSKAAPDDPAISALGLMGGKLYMSTSPSFAGVSDELAGTLSECEARILERLR